MRELLLFETAKQELEASMSLAAALALAGRHREALFHYSAALRKAQQVCVCVYVCVYVREGGGERERDFAW